MLSAALWTTFGENTNLGLLTGHSKAVTALCWSRTAPSHTPRLFTSSADGTLIAWEALSGTKLRRMRGHRGIVNCLAVTRAGREMLVSGGDDGKVLLWMWEEQSKPRESIDVGYPVTAVEFSEDGSQVFVGGLDNDVHVSTFSRSWGRGGGGKDAAEVRLLCLAKSRSALHLYCVSRKSCAQRTPSRSRHTPLREGWAFLRLALGAKRLHTGALIMYAVC